LRIAGLFLVGALVVSAKASKPELHVYWGQHRALSEVDTAPSPRFMPETHYPKAMRAQGTTGTAVISYVVGTDGNCKDLVVESATNMEFAQAAGATVMRMKYKPAKKGKRAVECRMEFGVLFAASPEGAPFPVGPVPCDQPERG
jgi:TonB family protein